MLRVFTVVILTVCAALPACSLPSIGGRFADWYALKKIDDYFDLTKTQDAYLEPRIKSHITWLKKNEAPVIDHDLAELITRLQRGLIPEDLTWIDSRINRLKSSLDQRLRPDALWLLTSLDDKQRSHLSNELQKRHQKWGKRLREDPEDYKEDRLERYEDTWEEWFDSISDEQRKSLHSMFSALASIEHGKLFLRGSEEANQAFLAAITPSSSNPDPSLHTRIDEFLTTWINDPATVRRGAAEAQYRMRTGLFRDSILLIDKQLTEKQRAYLIKKIESHRKDLKDFAKTAS